MKYVVILYVYIYCFKYKIFEPLRYACAEDTVHIMSSYASKRVNMCNQVDVCIPLCI